MNTTIKTLLTFAITIITISLNAQSQLLTPEELFIFHMSAYNQQPSGAIFLSNWLGQYISKFDSHNYNQAKNDEFQLHTYLESQNKRLLQKIQEANYTKLYYLSTSTTLGEYNFNSSTFPISFNAGSMDDGGGDAYGGVKSFLNDDDIDFNLKVSPNDASAFINSRKDKASGYVNRVVFLKVNFTLTRVHSTISFNSVQYTLVGYIHSIEVWSDPKFQGKKLGELIPRVKYDNPVQGIKKLNAIDTVYWDNKWRFVANKANASFYSVVKYEEGRIPDAIRSYYMSGVRQSEGRYISFYPKPNIPNGLFTWFYDKTGDLQAQVTYENGLYNGRFTSWYISGKPQEIVMYVNGNKDGCDKQYDEDGNCRNGSWSGPGYFDLYENGKNAVGKQVRPCDK